MNFDEYQMASRSTVLHHEDIPNYVHWALGLCGEANELQSSNVYNVPEEIGDLMWYVSNMAYDFGLEFIGEPWLLSKLAEEALLFKTPYAEGIHEIIEAAALIAESVKKITFYNYDDDPIAKEDKIVTVRQMLCRIIMCCRNTLSLAEDKPSLHEVLTDNIDKLKKRHKKE